MRSALTLLLVCSACVSMQSNAEIHAEVEAILAELDANGDGRLQPEELPPALIPLIGEGDHDGDGALSRRELVSLSERAQELDDEPAGEDLADEVEELFAACDADGDRRLVATELDGELADLLAEADTDGDEALTRAELTRFLEAEELPASFEVEGTRAVMTGVIGADTPDAVRRLLRDHPDVSTIVLRQVPGSLDDEANLEAARLVRAAGLHTHVPADGTIASGGVDFFLAGTERTVDPGARLGVHSWAADFLGLIVEGASFPRSHGSHEIFLAYYREMGVPEPFYWFTLESASAEGLHWMTPAEIRRFSLVLRP